jgi:hypothetical protein
MALQIWPCARAARICLGQLYAAPSERRAGKNVAPREAPTEQREAKNAAALLDRTSPERLGARKTAALQLGLSARAWKLRTQLPCKVREP